LDIKPREHPNEEILAMDGTIPDAASRMTHHPRRLWACASGLLLIFLPAAADLLAGAPQIGASQTAPPQSANPNPDSLGGAIDTAHRTASSEILNTAEWIDAFFRTETFQAEENRSRIKITSSGFAEEGEGIEPRVRVNVRLNLPGTERRTGLLIGYASDPQETQGVPGENRLQPLEDLDADRLTATIEHFLMQEIRQNLKLQAGLHWAHGSPQGRLGPRYRFSRDLADRWGMRFEQYFAWFTDEGWLARTRLDLERPLGDALFLRFTPGLTWSQDQEGLSYRLQASVIQPISARRALLWEGNTHYSSETSGQLDEANLRVRYRQRIWRDWLTLEVSPQLAWYEDRDFDTVLGIYVGIEGIFGWLK